MDHAVSILKLAGAMARHASHAHAATARNVARADIPDATALSVRDFEESLGRLARGEAPRTEDTGRRISIENEMLHMGEAAGRHEAALATWKSTLNMMRLAAAAPQ